MPLPHENLIDIHRLEAVVQRGERRLLENPTDTNTLALVETSRRLLLECREEFEDAAKAQGEDVVRYTVYGGRYEVPHFRDIASIFTSFENALLLTAQSKILDQPQRTRKIEAPVKDAALRYGYLFSDNEKQLGLVASTRKQPQQSNLDLPEEIKIPPPGDPRRFHTLPLTPALLRESANDVFSITRAALEPEKIASFAQKYGPGVINEINIWGKTHGQTNLDANAEWIGGKDAPLRMAAPATALYSLHTAIERLSDKIRSEVIEVKGHFAALNMNTRYFSFQSIDGVSKFNGHFSSKLISDKRPFKMPHQYAVTFDVVRRYNEALGSEVATYSILDYIEI